MTRAGLTFVLLALGAFLAMYTGVGCSENLHPGTSRTTVCQAIGFGSGDGELRAWLAIFAPAVLFVLAQLVPLFRRHPLGVAIAVALVSIAFWIPMMLIVSSNWLAG